MFWVKARDVAGHPWARWPGSARPEPQNFGPQHPRVVSGQELARRPGPARTQNLWPTTSLVKAGCSLVILNR